MSAVWRVARAAVRRRRLQTVIIGVSVGLSTTMIEVALGLLAASSGPFDQAYARQQGAHLVAMFDRAAVPDAELVRAAGQPVTEAVAGPFAVATVDVVFEGRRLAFPLAVAGRADPGGAVDRLNLWDGRWVSGPGEIVLNQNPAAPAEARLGEQVSVSGGRKLTVVGFAYTVSGSADAWATPDQVGEFHPATTQMLYRFAQAGTSAQLASAEKAVTAGLPAGALLGTQSYLTLKAWAAAEPGTFVPFLIVFGILGLAVSVLIVANVISGAVVAGIRHIGVLKALGFTPGQVLAVYLTMVSVPAVVGCVAGTVLGNVLATPLLSRAFQNYGSSAPGVAWWVTLASLIGMPSVVALSALLPALRARRLSASEAISAGSAQHTGRARRIQHWLGGTRLPRPVSLGLGLPFARPARSALTAAAVVLGVSSVTFAIGLAGTVTAYQKAQNRGDAVQVEVQAPPGQADPEQTLRSLPGTAGLTASAGLLLRLGGATEPSMVRFYRGDLRDLGYQALSGRLPTAAGEVAVSHRFLVQHGYAVGDTFLLERDGRRTRVRIVGKVLLNSAGLVLSTWPTLAQVAPGTAPDAYEIKLRPGTDADSYLAAVRAAAPGLDAVSTDDADSFIAIILLTVTLLTLMLGSVAALGVFNTAVLNTRERRRDLGMLKSIGMTPRQVTTMVVTSMAALGAAGGLLGIPLGVLAHHLVMPAMARAAQVAFPARMVHVYGPVTLASLALAGVALAALGAFLPARSAARATIATVLHNE
ncbi:ABC transporter permease [Actinoplanes sp. NPDC048791]|uniref:ABC transporter permease n=1 Tax=Actinoplanes sp. NPDC048791 TaxID=3154623 RepID=UPI0034072B5E